MTDFSHAAGQPVVYRTYPARFMGLFAIVILNISTGFVWLTYSSALKAAEAFLNTSENIVNLTTILYFIAFLIMSPVSGWMFEKKGIKYSLLFGATIQLIGAALRYIATFIESTPANPGPRLALTLVGQVIASGAQPFFLNAPPKFAAVWFSEDGRTTATMIGSVANALAAALAQLIIPVITTEEDPNSMATSVLLCLILSVVAFIPVILTPALPPTPPSPSAAAALEEQVEEPFHVSLKKVYTNRQFMILMTMFGTFVGFFNAFSSLITAFTKPFGYTAEESGYFGAAMVVAGIVGAGISGPLMDRTKQFKSVVKSMVPLSTIAYIVFCFVVRKDSFIAIMLVSVFIGFFSFTMLPVVLELGVECTYPVTPASSTSLLWASGQLFAVVFLFVLQGLQSSVEESKLIETGINPALIFIAAFCVLATIPVYFFKSPYLRLEAEGRARSNQGHVVVVDGKTDDYGMDEVSLEDTKDVKDAKF
ncbi:MAG: major facilitator superfamily domain-containing protein [Linnemannia gamsii]|nr:MAG: major facilitator superfamily domain-containing protein [Linnemannia gamsii]